MCVANFGSLKWWFHFFFSTLILTLVDFKVGTKILPIVKVGKKSGEY